MELKRYLGPLLKWWWLLVLSTGVAVGSTYIFTRDLPPVYLARTTLMTGTALTNPTGGEIGQAQQLAGLYATVAQQDSVREATRLALHLDELPPYAVRLTGNGIFIEISVTHTDAKLAQLVVNELAHQLVLTSPSQQQAGSERLVFVNQQLDELEAGITQTRADIEAKQAEISTATSASQISALQADLRALQDKFTLLQTTYGNLLATTPQSYTNIIKVVEPAALPQVPIGPNKRLLLVVAAVCGLLLAGGTAYLLEFLDDTLRTSEAISQVFQLPLIGFVPVMERKWVKGLYVVDQPHSAAAEAFRSLRTNLEFAGVDQPLKTILVTSVGAGEGKSTVSVNLALAIAQSGKQVLLLDADLRWPNIHSFFPVPDQLGLSDILRGQVGLSDAIHQSTEGGICVIPAGMPPPNPAEMLGSKKMEHILASLQEMFDVVVVDGPPFLVTDAWILSAKVDGVVLVVQEGRTSKNAARTMMDQIKRGRARLLGIVLNRIRRRGDNYYYRNYLHSVPTANSNGHRRGRDGRADAQGIRKFWPLKFPRRTKSSEGDLSAVAVDQFEAPALTAERVVAKRARTALDLFLAISRELAAPGNLPEVLKRLLQLTLEGVGASSGSMVILDKAGQVTCGALAYAGKVYTPTPQQLADTVERGLAGWVIENREAVLIASTRDDPRWLARDWDQNKNVSRSAISVPLSVGGRVFGALTLVHPRAGQFEEDDLTLLKTVGVCLSFNPEAMSPSEAPHTSEV